MALNDGIEHKALGPFEDKGEGGRGDQVDDGLIEIEAIHHLTIDGMPVVPGATVRVTPSQAADLANGVTARRVP